jgi:hypothetical protein
MDSEDQEVLQYADNLYLSAMTVMAVAEPKIQGKWNRDPKIIGLTILGRSLSIFKAALLLARANQVLEARMLARPMYENLLWIAALRERGASFVEEMVEDDALNRKSLGQTTMKLTAQRGSDPNAAGGLILREIIRALAKTYEDPKKLHADKVAAMGKVELLYVDYTRLSLDSLHCSVTALGHHISSERVSDLETIVTVAVEPKFGKDEMARTVRHLCRALMGVAITANELVGFTSASASLTAAVHEFETRGWTSAE